MNQYHEYLFYKDFTKLGNSLFLFPRTSKIFSRSATVEPSIMDSNLSANCSFLRPINLIMFSPLENVLFTNVVCFCLAFSLP